MPTVESSGDQWLAEQLMVGPARPARAVPRRKRFDEIVVDLVRRSGSGSDTFWA